MKDKQINKDEEILDTTDDQEIQPDIGALSEVYPTAVNVTKDDSSVFELKRQYDRKRIELSPSYQRESVWSKKQKSELIESILMGIPLPIMYFFQDNQGIKQVVDGKQRLTTLFDFLDNRFSLSELTVMPELKGKKFDDLDGLYQGKIEDYKLSINVIKPPTPDRIKFDIFDRVNRGGTRLNNQEMRNAIYQGEATKLLDRLKDNEDFKNATDNSVRSKVMKDRYMILRFIAFYLWKEKLLTTKNGEFIDYKSDIDSFLGKTMEFLNFTSSEMIMDIENIFKKAMSNSYNILGSNGFRVSTYYHESYKRPVNMALFEVLSYLMTKIDLEDKEVLLDKITRLINEDEFYESITTPVDSAVKVNKRFDYIDKLIMEIQ